jgi:hypothetical protein
MECVGFWKALTGWEGTQLCCGSLERNFSRGRKGRKECRVQVRETRLQTIPEEPALSSSNGDGDISDLSKLVSKRFASATTFSVQQPLFMNRCHLLFVIPTRRGYWFIKSDCWTEKVVAEPKRFQIQFGQV